MQKVWVLRWGHRRQRDARLTSHVLLTARALGAAGFTLSDIEDQSIKLTIDKVKKNWGGTFFFEMGVPWQKTVRAWKDDGKIIVHLTAYGENIQTSDVMQKIKSLSKDILVIIGGKKVPKEFFSKEVSDFNLAIGNQPHSECASLAIFLDRFFNGQELMKNFNNAKIKIVPQKRGKKIKTTKN
ncbi:MAG: tRNA (cytidine(56)-2'-O)-methyltransferase [Candidatus Bathyarchaeota archaeon]|jgi:tRNA (cytidine56-2'-O)-methyltransferase